MFLDGRKVEQTPVVLRGLRPGRHKLLLQAKGFQPAPATVTLKPGDRKQLPIELRR